MKTNTQNMNKTNKNNMKIKTTIKNRNTLNNTHMSKMTQNKTKIVFNNFNLNKVMLLNKMEFLVSFLVNMWNLGKLNKLKYKILNLIFPIVKNYIILIVYKIIYFK